MILYRYFRCLDFAAFSSGVRGSFLPPCLFASSLCLDDDSGCWSVLCRLPSRLSGDEGGLRMRPDWLSVVMTGAAVPPSVWGAEGCQLAC